MQGQDQSLRIKSADASGEGYFGGGVAGIVKARIGEIDISPTNGARSRWSRSTSRILRLDNGCGHEMTFDAGSLGRARGNIAGVLREV